MINRLIENSSFPSFFTFKKVKRIACLSVIYASVSNLHRTHGIASAWARAIRRSLRLTLTCISPKIYLHVAATQTVSTVTCPLGGLTFSGFSSGA